MYSPLPVFYYDLMPAGSYNTYYRFVRRLFEMIRYGLNS